MAVPGSGPISLFKVMREINSINRATMFGGNASNSENYDYDNTVDIVTQWAEFNPPYTPRPISLKEMSDGTTNNQSLNTIGDNHPDHAAPHKLSEFYYYDHNLTQGGGGPDS